MKIGAISDTHDHVERIKKVIEILNKEKISLASLRLSSLLSIAVEFYGFTALWTSV